ncbi:hypothetical protein CK203_067029 [Vitis vinifera]|uniref:Uncharacterized protein n=1 Tax=Vitis vinifera TaxID=29760 RepID=A0A438F5V3_VITVI|nr:hypothetical protein CK203_067029 [Vitis vinifera]
MPDYLGTSFSHSDLCFLADPIFLLLLPNQGGVYVISCYQAALCGDVPPSTSSILVPQMSPQLIKLLIMEKSRSFPDHPYSYSDARHGFELRSNSYSFNGPIGKVDEFATSDNPEMKRRKRVASYNMYSMEGKLKSSLRNSFKWIKNKFTDDYYDDM